MENLDVDSRLTNNLLEETIEICANTLLKILKKQKVYQKQNFSNFCLLLQNNFIFTEKFYKQVHGVTMVSLLGLTLTKCVLIYFEKNWLQENRPSDFNPIQDGGCKKAPPIPIFPL